MKQTIEVEIAGTALRLVTEEDEAYVRALADKLDGEMTRRTLSTRQTRLEAALVLALGYLDDLAKVKRENQILAQRVENFERTENEKA